ncbi:MAG: hypothetical protein FVQ83_15220 [Chloroflexi bacterium]|nr:hypothetical protein [Chloroflexota bacterium]
MSSRQIYFILALLAGLGVGLLYGWVVSPVEFIDTTTDTLRVDYKTDYVLMVAEAYASEADPSLAVLRLASLGGASASESVQDAITYAAEVGYSAQDIVLLRELDDALRNWNTTLEFSEP